MVMDALGTREFDPKLPMELPFPPVGKILNFISGRSPFQFAVLFILLAFDLIWNTLTCCVLFCQLAKHRADAMILDDTFSAIVTGVKWGCSAYIYNIQKFAEFQLKNVLPLIVYFSSACLAGYAQLTAVLLLILGALSEKTMSKRILLVILMGLVFVLEIQVVEGRGLKAVSDVKGSPPLISFKGMFSAEKKMAYPPPAPLAARPPHH